MKKIIIAVFIVIATLGIAAGTKASSSPNKTTTKKSTSTPKKEVTDPYVGWWYHEYDQTVADEFGNDRDDLYYVSKENGKYYGKSYDFFPKEKGAEMCKRFNGQKYEIESIKEEISKDKKATKEQVEILKYNLENAKWLPEKFCNTIS